jgi:polysaccharide deacetylase family protein (PEP-CTERM system associated)
MNNIMSVDLEDYYCDLPISIWDRHESRVVKATRTILSMFDKYKVNATFFTVGYIAEKHPELIEEVKSNGHEIASHGYSHHNVKKINREDFEADLVKSLEILRKTSGGQKIIGFRAPYFSVNKQNFWAFDVMRKYLRYDSSIFPVKFLYGLPKAPRYIYRMSYSNPLKEDCDSSFTEITHDHITAATCWEFSCWRRPLYEVFAIKYFESKYEEVQQCWTSRCVLHSSKGSRPEYSSHSRLCMA